MSDRPIVRRFGPWVGLEKTSRVTSSSRLARLVAVSRVESSLPSLMPAPSTLSTAVEKVRKRVKATITSIRVKPPSVVAARRWAAAGRGGGVRMSGSAYSIRSKMENIGMYSATIMPPTTTPRNPIISGSMSEVRASVVASTSSS